MPHPSPSDHALLRAYTAHDDQPAFAQLVTRHVDMVYAAARRQLAGDRELAQDVTQAVFLLLAQRARANRISPRTLIPGWLHTTTRYAAANARRAAATRRHHERQAAKLMSRPTPTATTEDALPAWGHLAPLLDTALARLPATDRNAVLLRFIENKSHADVGASLGLTEEAARKRISRALDRLRVLLLRRNVALPATTLATLLTTNATEAAPPTLTAACGLAAPATAVTALANSTNATLTWIKVKLTAACLAASVVVAAAAMPPALRALRPSTPSVAANPQPPITPPPPIHLAADAPPAAPARTINGTIVNASGDPIPDAEVLLATPDKYVNAYGPNANRPRVITEPDGKFSFPRPAGEWQIVVRTDAGYAQATADDLAKSPLVIPQPWGRLEGTLYAGVGGQPMPRHPVAIDPGYTGTDLRPRVVTRTRTVTTDDAGHFVFDRVAPGDLLVCQTDNNGLECKWEWAMIEPGKTANVKLGLAGPAVTGQLLAPPDGTEKAPFASAPRLRWRIEVRPDRTKPLWDKPDGWDTWPDQRKWEFERQQRWDQTPVGREFRRTMSGECYPVAPDGRFHIDALRTGNYRMLAYCFIRVPNTNRIRVITAGTAKFTVPDSAPPGKPIEIPPIPTKPVPQDDGL